MEPKAGDANRAANLETDPKTRLLSICALEQKIVEIPNRAAEVVTALNAGKKALGDSEQCRDAFSKALTLYNDLIQEINHGLRAEVERLHMASKSELIPLSVRVKASSTGTEKGQQLVSALYKLQTGEDFPQSVIVPDNHGNPEVQGRQEDEGKEAEAKPEAETKEEDVEDEDEEDDDDEMMDSVNLDGPIEPLEPMDLDDF